MSSDEVRDEILFLPCLFGCILIQDAEGIEKLGSGFSHRIQCCGTYMLGSHFQLAADIVADQMVHEALAGLLVAYLE
ncbi:hypothetical protein DSECCO2_456420 [anaerobic digester metagenome]